MNTDNNNDEYADVTKRRKIDNNIFVYSLDDKGDKLSNIIYINKEFLAVVEESLICPSCNIRCQKEIDTEINWINNYQCKNSSCNIRPNWYVCFLCIGLNYNNKFGRICCRRLRSHINSKHHLYNLHHIDTLQSNDNNNKYCSLHSVFNGIKLDNLVKIIDDNTIEPEYVIDDNINIDNVPTSTINANVSIHNKEDSEKVMHLMTIILTTVVMMKHQKVN